MRDKPLSLLRKTHSIFGVTAAIFLIVISITGILLNHTNHLDLDQYAVPAFIAAHYYRQEEIAGYQIEGDYYYVLGGKLYAKRKEISPCEQLQGVILFRAQLVVLCANELLLFNSGDILIERIGAAHGLPGDLNRISQNNSGLLVANAAQVYSFDIETLLLQPVQLPSGLTVNQAFHWPLLQPVPPDWLLEQSVSWQKFILDLHSGAFVGIVGTGLSDLLALILICMAISGTLIWRNAR